MRLELISLLILGTGSIGCKSKPKDEPSQAEAAPSVKTAAEPAPATPAAAAQAAPPSACMTIKDIKDQVAKLEVPSGDPCAVSESSDLNGDGLTELQAACGVGSTRGGYFILYRGVPNGCYAELGEIAGDDWGGATGAKVDGFPPLSSRLDVEVEDGAEMKYVFDAKSQRYVQVGAGMAASAAPKAGGDPYRIQGLAVGKVTVGASVDDVLATSGLRGKRESLATEDGSEDVVHLYEGKESVMTLSVEDDRVRRITVHSEKYATAEGAHVGMKAKDVLSAYGKVREEGVSCEDNAGTDVGFGKNSYWFTFKGCGGWKAVLKRNDRLEAIEIF